MEEFAEGGRERFAGERHCGEGNRVWKVMEFEGLLRCAVDINSFCWISISSCLGHVDYTLVAYSKNEKVFFKVKH